MDDGITIEQIIRRAINDGLTLEIEYAKNSSEKSSRVISDVSLSEEHGAGYISAYCHMKEDKRTFKVSRIVYARIVPKRTEKQLNDYDFDASKPIFNLYGEEY